MRIEPGSSTRNVQCSIRLEGSRIDGEFMTLGEVGYLMENLGGQKPQAPLAGREPPLFSSSNTG